MNKYMAAFILFIILLTLLVSGGCKDNEDTVFPEITVSEPMQNTIYGNGDTISFRATFSDNSRLSTIEVILVDLDNKPMLANISLVPDMNPYILEGTYIIDDPMLPGGVYQLRFRASDGVNTANHFVKIQIQELERKLLYPLIVTHPEGKKWQVYRMKENNSWQNIYTHSGDYIGSAVNSPASQLYMCGISESNLSALRLPEGLELWHVKPGIHQSLRWFEGITYNYPYLYVSCAEGNIRGYDKTGVEVYKTGTYPNGVPGLSVTTKNFVIGSFKDSFNNENRLVAYHNPGGLMIRNKFIQCETISLLFLESDKILLFCNKNGQGSISLYDATDNTFAELHPFYEGAFFEAIIVDSDNFLVSSSTGLYWYRYSKNSLTPFAADIINGHLAYDNTTGIVYTCSGLTMKALSFPFATLVDSYELPDTITDLHLVYNK